MHKKEIRELLCSMLLGDGSLVVDKRQHRNTNSIGIYYSMGHSTKQQDYLFWKVNEINKIFQQKDVDLRCRVHSPYAIHLKSNGKTYYAQKAKLHWDSYLKFLYYRVYKPKDNKRIKNINYLLNNMSTDKHLFIWFADDGTEIRQKHKHKDGTIYYRRPVYRLNTNNFTEGEVQLAKQWFESRYDVSPTISHSARTQGYKPLLDFSPNKAEKIFQHIGVYIRQLESMKHKFRLSLERY